MKKLNEFVTIDEENTQITLAFDDDGYFYVNGKKVLTEQKITLDWWVNIALAAGGFSTLGLFFIEIKKAFFLIM